MRSALLAIAFAAAASPAAAAKETRVHFWIDAFIADAWPGSGSVVREAGNTSMIQGPYLNSKATACFSTDSRGFDPSPNSSARLRTQLTVVIDKFGSGIRVKLPPGGANSVGPTKRLNCTTGNVVETRTADVSGMTIGPIRRDGWKQSVKITASVGNPFYEVASVGFAPRIDYEVTITFDQFHQRLNFVGETGTFPSFQAYVQIDEKLVQVLMQRHPEKGVTAKSLLDLGTGLRTVPFSATILPRAQEPTVRRLP